jgi:hypothetical protein
MALLVCLAFDGGYWHAVGKVDTEIRARLAVSARTVENAVAEGLGEGGARTAGIAGEGIK